MTRKPLARLVFGLAIAQAGFSILAQPILGTNEIFPLFNWKIYRAEPIRRDHRIVLAIRRLDGRMIDPPLRIDEMKAEFPSVNSYLLESIVEQVKSDPSQTCDDLAVGRIDRVLAPAGFKRIEWEIADCDYDVLAFYLRGETLARTLKCTHVSKF